MTRGMSSLHKDLQRLEFVVQDMEEHMQDVDVMHSDTVRFEKKLLNYSLLDRHRFFIASMNITKGLTVSVDVTINLIANATQMFDIAVYFDDDKAIWSSYKIHKDLTKAQTVHSYYVKKGGMTNIYVDLFPQDGYEVILTDIKLEIIGKYLNENFLEYKVTPTNDRILFSMLDGGEIFYKYLSKNEQKISKEDFLHEHDAISHDFACIEIEPSKYATFLFRVDLIGNLWVCDLSNRFETFVAGGVKKVSASSDGKKALVVYLKNNSIFYFEFDGKIKSQSSLKINNLKVIGVKSFFSEKLNKFFISFCDKNLLNYLMIESDNEKSDFGEKINAEFSLEISTYDFANNSNNFKLTNFDKYEAR